MSNRDERLTTRCGAALYASVYSIGTESAAVRALLIIGLHAIGFDCRDLTVEAAATMNNIDCVEARAALVSIIGGGVFNKCSTNVQQTSALPLTAPPDFMSVEYEFDV